MSEVFVRGKKTVDPTFTVGVTLGRTPKKGLVGLEIEVEGKKLIHDHEVPAGWSYHIDGSLRGEENAEYVLSQPIAFEEVRPMLEKLWDALKKKGAVLDDSNRTSVHVHLNCQDFHLNRLTAFMALYFTFEEILTEWCGEHRVGNLFCLRAKDAPAIVSHIRRFIRSDGKAPLSDNLHYAGLNAQALAKFGSLEVRTLRGCSEPETILTWVQILERLYRVSEEFTDPREVCGRFSAGGPMAFFESILGGQVSAVRSVVKWDDDRIRDSMYDGIRMAQDLCYCRDWDAFKSIDLAPDPFGRDPKKIAKKLVGANTSVASEIEQYLATLNTAESSVVDDYDPNEDADEDEVEPEFNPPATEPAPTQINHLPPIQFFAGPNGSIWATAQIDDPFNPQE